jgi:hypothetical protein
VEGPFPVVKRQVPHGVEPKASAGGVVTGGRERGGQGLDNGSLAEGQGVNHRRTQRTKS